MMNYGWFVKLRTLIFTSTKCTWEPTHGTEVKCLVVNKGISLLSGLGQGGKSGWFRNPLVL